MAARPAKKAAAQEPAVISVPPEYSIGYQVRRLSQRMSAAMDRFVSPHGISSAQWGYLRHIYFEDGMSQRELSDRIGRQGATTVNAMKRLEQMDYVEIRPNEFDQRKNRVYLTPKGRKLVGNLMHYVKEVEAIAFRGFDEAEIAAIWDIIDRMQGNFEQASGGRRPPA